MFSNELASRYAKALLGAAYDKNQIRPVYLNMKNLNIIYKSNPKLLDILQNTILAPSKKTQLIKKLLGKDLHELTKDFLTIIERRNRAAYLIDIAKSFLSQYNKSKDLKTVHFTSVVKLSEKIEEKLKKQMKEILKCEKVKIIQYLDPSLLGGYIMRVGDKQIDNSILFKLKKMRINLAHDLRP